MYVKQFQIEHINAEISFIFKTKTSGVNFVGSLKYLQTSGLSLINIDEANFKLKRLATSDIYIGVQDFQDMVNNYYIEKIIREVKKMALSIGFFGSPRTLVKYCRDGFCDFIEMPKEGW